MKLMTNKQQMLHIEVHHQQSLLQQALKFLLHLFEFNLTPQMSQFRSLAFQNQPTIITNIPWLTYKWKKDKKKDKEAFQIINYVRIIYASTT
ncbi:CLUMA_CG019167, isoform A [Clunio marinus]|uniref:CLUMA_CG019167, isoform A n=1 Tax=Clunio marinus TaxID=568069 RepID=A0A1J1J1D3_9DIPT|nr:CLUMA_CG019167, isoform A [Clunio marinus]